jgi:hypothetical protein
MTQENKELLLKDLCGRLPHGVHVEYKDVIYVVLGISHGRLILCKPFMSQTLEYYPLVEEVRSYLFPLSSMTEEQEMEYDATFDTIVYEDGRKDSVMTYKSFDWLNKNHFDYRGLIPMGLVIDCTNLNIY